MPQPPAPAAQGMQRLQNPDIDLKVCVYYMYSVSEVKGKSRAPASGYSELGFGAPHSFDRIRGRAKCVLYAGM